MSKTNKLSEKKEAAGNISEQHHRGWIHIIRVHDTTHFAVTKTSAGQQMLVTYPTQRKTLKG